LFTAAGEQVSFRTRKHLALLVRLALEPGKQFTRDYLADLLWPNFAPKLANHSLAQGLSVIKAKVAREAVVLRRSTVGLAAGWIDVDVNHLDSSDVSIDGPFLDALQIESARPFEDWKDEYRARLTPQLRDCLVRQMDAARRIGDFPTVQRHAERLQDLDPLAEEAIRGIMEARAWASDRSGALKAFARYEGRLAEELGAKTGPDLLRMADLLRDGRRTTASSHKSLERIDRRFEPERLIGREREFSVLYDAWLQARQRCPRIVVITSDPGVGKTTLVNAFASTCQMDGATVARAQAYDAERELPFAVLGELVKQLAMQRAIGAADPEALSELTRISSEVLREFPGVPKPVAWSPDLMPLRIADAFLKTIRAVAADAPVMIVVDDIHAADNASIAILHSVARKLGDTRVLMILAGRTSEMRLSGAPWSLTSDQSIAVLRSLELEVLPPEAAADLVRRLLPSQVHQDAPVERILRASGRNPLAVELITREWSEHGDASILRDLEALDTQPVPVIGIPRAIGAMFERQSRRLEPPIRATLDLAAILGRRLNDVGLYSAIDLTPGQAAGALSRLRDEGYLREVSGDLEFRNELIRAQAYYAVAATTRLHLHRRVANLLAHTHPYEDATVSLEIAWHQLRGRDPVRAIPFAIKGAEAVLAVGVPHSAEEILRAIVDLPASKDSRTVRLLLAKALIDQSKAEPALPIIEQLGEDVTQSAQEQAEVSILRALTEFLLNNESGEKYSEVVRGALQSARRSEDNNLIARALLECSRAGIDQGVTELVRIAQDGIEELKQKTDIEGLPNAILTRALCKLFFMDHVGSLRDLKSFVARNASRANKAQLALGYSGIGLSLFNLCRLRDAFDAYQNAFELTKQMGDDARLSTMAANICVLQSARGFHDDAIRWGEMSVALGESSKSNSLQMPYSNLVDPYMLTGKRAEAVACLDRARAWLGPRRRWKFHCGFVMGSASFALMEGNIGFALDLIAQLETLARGKEEAVPIPGSYWKFRILKEAHLGNLEEANRLALNATRLLREASPMSYLDVLAAKGWLEIQKDGIYGAETMRELSKFDDAGALGRRALLTAQGFLKPLPSSEARDEPEATGERLPPHRSGITKHPQGDGARVI
jgi:DNA-binding SARP family transcriptional activator/tetratricopeptide (TPR) repeat protein